MTELIAGHLELFATFIVPGFIAIKVWDLLVPSTRRDFSKMVIELVVYSMLFFPVVEWIRGLMIGAKWNEDDPFLYSVGLLGAIVVPAMVATVAFHRLRLLAAAPLQLPSPVPAGYDYAFSQEGPLWLYFHLQDGRILVGGYEEGCCAGTGVSSREIYVSQPHFLDPEGRSEPMLGADFALVKYDDCTLIGFERPSLKGDV